MLTRARAHTHTATHATYTKTSTRRRVIKSAHSHVRPHSTTVVASSARGESVVMELPHTSSSLSASFGCASVRWMRGRGSKEREREREQRGGRGEDGRSAMCARACRPAHRHRSTHSHRAAAEPKEVTLLLSNSPCQLQYARTCAAAQQCSEDKCGQTQVQRQHHQPSHEREVYL